MIWKDEFSYHGLWFKLWDKRSYYMQACYHICYFSLSHIFCEWFISRSIRTALKLLSHMAIHICMYASQWDKVGLFLLLWVSLCCTSVAGVILQIWSIVLMHKSISLLHSIPGLLECTLTSFQLLVVVAAILCMHINVVACIHVKGPLFP